MKYSDDIRDNLDDIQGNILRAYNHPHAVYCFWRFGSDQGKKFLRRLLKIGVTNSSIWPVDPETGKNRKPSFTLNCALSFAGLDALGVDVSRLQLLPTTFKEGMRTRAKPLGDTGSNAPELWQDALNDNAIHAMVIIHAANTAERKAQIERVQLAAQESGVTKVAEVIEADALPESQEHFGFKDGIGQPSIEGGFVDSPGMGTPIGNAEWRALKPGEFVHGYESERQRPETPAKLLELIDNGSYLVFRQLQQNVAEFRLFLKVQSENAFGSDSTAAQTRLASNLVGRWPSGASLVQWPDKDPGQSDNNFRYKDDSDGLRCPLGAHIRRCNPRDGLAVDTHVSFHRILRRGMPYGPAYADTPDADRGLVFIALNTDIEAQFEFVQEQWMNNGEFTNLSADERDPIAGNNQDGKLTLPGATQSPFIFGLNSFVRTRGGGYFFMPGIKALGLLADGKL